MVYHGAEGKHLHTQPSGYSTIDSKKDQVIADRIKNQYTVNRLLAHMMYLSRIYISRFHGVQGILFLPRFQES
jgi:uncharacterized damage-inducible protein DinB